METQTVELWITRAAVALGVVTIALPLSASLRSISRPRGRTSGSIFILLRWPAILAVTLAYIGVAITLWKPIPIELGAWLRLTVLLIGSILYLSGALLYLWGFRTLGPMYGVSSGLAAELYERHRLIEKGPYRVVRHPMYLGVLLASVGALLIFRTWAMALYTPSSFGVILRARREEKLLAEEFGDRWEAYKERVPGWIPKLSSRGDGPT